MTTKSIRQLCFILSLLLMPMHIPYNVISDQRDSNRLLTQQNAELQQNIDNLTEQIKRDEAYIASLKQQKEKSSRGGERPTYNPTSAERSLVEQVVMAEAAGEPYEGQMLVAQCVLNACKKDGVRPAEAVDKYVYARSRPEPSTSIVKAVEAVFDRGITVVDEPVIYFYAPGRVESEFHESQRFICEVGGHRFFAEAD